MNSILKSMLVENTNEKEINSEYKVKEIIQELVLYTLSDTDFFNKAAFYGGTALRLFYGLDRFSEDLDFSLKTKDERFDIEPYLNKLKNSFSSFGLNFSISLKEKNIDTNIMSAFLKSNTKNLFLIFFDKNENVSEKALTKIKIEIDTSPPDYATFENKYRLKPMPYEICMYDEPSLFAGKIHAILCRLWKNKIKGRDLYDYIFYIAKKASLNIKHLEARLKDSKFLNENESLDKNKLKSLLIEHFEKLDIQEAKKDIAPFISNPEKIKLWSNGFFIDITKNYFI